jgi:hypothetical protein
MKKLLLVVAIACMATVGCNSENKNDGSADSIDTNINNQNDEMLNNQATDSASMSTDSAGMSSRDSAGTSTSGSGTTTSGSGTTGSGNQNR